MLPLEAGGAALAPLAKDIACCRSADTDQEKRVRSSDTDRAPHRLRPEDEQSVSLLDVAPLVNVNRAQMVSSGRAATLIDQRGRRPRPLCLRGRPGCQQRHVQGVTLMVGQIVTVIVDEQLQLGAVRRLGRLVEVQSPVLHALAQRGHVTTVRPSTAGWHADRENRYGRAPSNTSAYVNKSLQELCRNCVRPTRKPRGTGTNTASHRRVRSGGKSLIELCVEVRGCRSA